MFIAKNVKMRGSKKKLQVTYTPTTGNDYIVHFNVFSLCIYVYMQAYVFQPGYFITCFFI